MIIDTTLDYKCSRNEIQKEKFCSVSNNFGNELKNMRLVSKSSKLSNILTFIAYYDFSYKTHVLFFFLFVCLGLI